MTLGTTDPDYDLMFGYGVYNNVTVNTPNLGTVAFPAGIYNQLYAAGEGSQITGVQTNNSINSGTYPVIGSTTTDARYTALYGGGANSLVRGERLELFLKNDDGLNQNGYGIKMANQSMGAGDKMYGWYMDDAASVTGGTEYGVYLNLDDADAIRYGIYETGGAINYFKGNVGIGDVSPLSLLTVGNGDLFQVNSSGAIVAAAGITSSGNITFSGLTASRGVFTTSGGLITTSASSQYLIDSLSDETGTGSAVFNTSPTFTTKIEVNGGIRLNTVTAKPTCDTTQRGTFWVTQGTAGVKDAVEVCAKDAGDTYAWRPLY